MRTGTERPGTKATVVVLALALLALALAVHASSYNSFVVPISPYALYALPNGTIVTIPPGNYTVGSGFIEVIVNDPQGAGWSVSWSYAGQGQSYEVAESSTYAWFLNPPYLPIQVSFEAQITRSPSPDYQCSISPSRLSGVFGPGQVVVFNVTCVTAAYVTVYSPIMDGQWVIQTSAGSISGSQSVTSDPLPVPPGGGEVTAYTTNPLCTISPTSAYAKPGQSLVFNVSCTTEWLFNVQQCPVTGYGVWTSWVCPTITINWQTQWGLGPGYSGSSGSYYFFTNSPGNYTYSMTLGEPNEEVLDWSIGLDNPGWYYGSVSWTANPSSGWDTPGGAIIYVVVSGSLPQSSSGSSYLVYVTVTNDTLGAQWRVASSASSMSGSTDVTNDPLAIGGPTDTLYASITLSPSGYTCSISPSSVSATNGLDYTFTVNCYAAPQPQPQACTVVPPSVSSQPPGAPQPSSYASASSIPYGSSESVTFTYEAPVAGSNYVFQYWSIGGVKYSSNVVTITEELACTTPGEALTGPGGTAYYQYQPPGSISINPDTIDLRQPSENYTLAWSSAWSGYEGTLSWGVSGYATIYYDQQPYTQGIRWWASVTGVVDGATMTFAQGSGDLAITAWPNPPNHYYYITCTVGGSGSVPSVGSSGGEVTVKVTITCTLHSRVP